MHHYQKIIFREDKAELVGAILQNPPKKHIIVKSRCSLISPGTEKAALTRVWDDDWFRSHPGYALAGDVIELGEEVIGFEEGDRVITLMNHASLAMAPIDPWMTLKIPDLVSYEHATFIVLGSVALHAIHRARLEWGDTFAIIGMGIIGQIALQLAKMGGASRVIAVDYAENRLALAEALGADYIINPSVQDLTENVMKITSKKGVPVILECAGTTQVLPQAFKIAAIGGRVITTGILEDEIPMNFHQDFTRRELSLISAYQPLCPVDDNVYWHWTQQANRSLLLDMIAKEKLNVGCLLTHFFPARQAAEAYEHVKMSDPQMLGILLEWDK